MRSLLWLVDIGVPLKGGKGLIDFCINAFYDQEKPHLDFLSWAQNCPRPIAFVLQSLTGVQANEIPAPSTKHLGLPHTLGISFLPNDLITATQLNSMCVSLTMKSVQEHGVGKLGCLIIIGIPSPGCLPAPDHFQRHFHFFLSVFF